MTTKLFSLLACVLTAVCMGCAESGGDDTADLVPVSGVVTLDGAPLTNASVRFVPDESTEGTSSYSATDKDGKFVLKNPRQREGCKVGKFKVVISKFALPDGSPIPEGEDAITAGAVEQVPEQYSDPEKTTLSAEVPAGGKDDFKFELSSE